MAKTYTLQRASIRVFLLCSFLLQAMAFSSISVAQDRLSSELPTVQEKVFDGRDLSKLGNVQTHLGEEWNTSDKPRWDIAATLAMLSRMVYDDDVEMLDYTLGSMGFKKWVEIRKGSVVAHVISGESVSIVILRGTEPLDIDDWRFNFNTRFRTYVHTGECRFHEGFWEAYASIRKDLYSYLDKNKTKSTWLTGHSLGGAMATLCAVEIECTRPDIKPVLVTFGQPRAADAAGAKWIDERLLNRYARFVHGNDIVPSLPPTLLFSYAHAGQLIAIRAGEVTRDTSEVISPIQLKSRSSNSKSRQAYGAIGVYQSPTERMPLTQAEFDRYFPIKQYAVAADCTSTCQAGAALPFADYIFDHGIYEYLTVIRSNR